VKLSDEPRNGDVELLAFEMWLERGAPIGTPEIDWYRAEELLRGAPGESGSPLTSLGKEIGSLLGSLAALTVKAKDSAQRDN
jgi:hypothetical protein